MPMMRLVGNLVRGGRIIDDPIVENRSGVTDLTVTGHGPFPYQVDGDHLGDAEVLQFQWRPDVLSLVLPTS